MIHHNGVDLSPGSGTAGDFSGLIKTFIVTAEDGTTAEYTVVVDLEPLDTSGGIAGAVGSYIAAVPATYSGTTAGTPIPLPARIDFSTEWQELLTAIDTAGKYVALDLSACAMTGTFDPDSTNSTGKDKIVSLVLPDGAGRIKAGNPDNIAFEHFSALKSVSGAGIVTVGDWAFGNREIQGRRIAPENASNAPTRSSRQKDRRDQSNRRQLTRGEGARVRVRYKIRDRERPPRWPAPRAPDAVPAR